MNEAVGTLPHAKAHRSGPSLATIAAVSAADSVSFQSFAGRIERPAASTTTIPCCCAATDIARTSESFASRPAARIACPSAFHHAVGSCSLRGGLVGGCDPAPNPKRRPLSASRISTFVDWVEESTPSTSGMRVTPRAIVQNGVMLLIARREAVPARADRAVRGRNRRPRARRCRIFRCAAPRWNRALPCPSSSAA